MAKRGERILAVSSAALTAVFAWMVLSVVPAFAESAQEILQRVRTAYAGLPSFSEAGILTEVTSEGGAEQRHEIRFELAVAGGEVWLTVPLDSEGGKERLGDQERAALAVPGLLADATWPGFRQASLEGQEPCGASACWVISLTEETKPGGEILRLWVDTETSYVWKTELRIPGEAARTLVVEHEPREFGPLTGDDLWATATAQEGQSTLEGFSEEITVGLSTATLWVVDHQGRPVNGLRPEDFRAVLAGREIPVAAVDWVSSRQTGQDGAGAAPAPGKLIVFLVQASPVNVFLSGQMRLRRQIRELLDTLAPEDRVAVLSFDSHLKLWQDFTLDRDAAHRALDRGMLFGGDSPVPPRLAEPGTLAAHFDLEQARAAASVGRALDLTGRALLPLHGEKVVVFLGYGMGESRRDDKEVLAAALASLQQARAPVFVLDIVQGSSHSLVSSLLKLAAHTGGTYAKTYFTPDLATRKLAGLFSGHYVLSFDSGTIQGGGTLQVTLKDSRRGTVLARSVSPVDPDASDGR
ncbi:MAG TPA: hypothetical protein VEL74_03545 [Thermoanaerobaculia bacterium]|nr:hypothetical protein [Thermoanaerobaculia bacterium]